MAINPGIPVALYVQIKETIKASILDGQMRPGDQLPPETELVKQYGVSRMTVRQAILELVNEGLLYRRRGKGTFVAQPKITQGLCGLTSFTEDMETRGLRPSGRVLSLGKVPADKEVADLLGVQAAAPVVRLERLRLADGRPMALEVSHLPVPRFEWLLREDLSDRSLYRLLRDACGLDLARARQTIEVAVANPCEAAILKVHAGAPLLRMERVAFDRKGEAVEAVRSLYRADRYKFVLDLPRFD